MSDMIIMIIQITPILVICSVAFSWIKRLLIIRKYKEMEQIKLECDIKKILHIFCVILCKSCWWVQYGGDSWFSYAIEFSMTIVLLFIIFNNTVYIKPIKTVVNYLGNCYCIKDIIFRDKKKVEFITDCPDCPKLKFISFTEKQQNKLCQSLSDFSNL